MFLKRFSLLLLMAMVVLLVVRCKVQKDEGDKQVQLNRILMALDSGARVSNVNIQYIEESLDRLSNELSRNLPMDFDNGRWSTHVILKTDIDSSIVLIKSTKKSSLGFKKESILCIADTVLLVKRFEVTMEESVNKGDCEMVEVMEYLSSEKMIFGLYRYRFPISLSDTSKFSKVPFSLYSRADSSSFAQELKYVREIRNWN